MTKTSQPGHFRSFLQLAFHALVIAILTCPAFGAASNRLADRGKRDIDVYSVNAYIGADLAPALLIDPTDPGQALATTTKIYSDILNSKPDLRMAAIAEDIALRQPDLVGVVELYRLEVAPAIPDTRQFVVVHDYLRLLTEALAQMGVDYRVAVVSRESEVTLPLLNPLNMEELLLGRITDSEAILVRSDLPPGFLTVSNPQVGQFRTRIMLPEFGIDLKRGWCSVDAFVRGTRFRVICAHLEDDAAPLIQYAQAQELLGGPAATPLPVILLGDFNADPLGRNGTATYPLFRNAGYRDSWLELNPGNPQGGLTWGRDALLADPGDPLEWRLDLVLHRGGIFTPVEAEVSDLVTGSTAPPLWASDHAALAVSFRIGTARPTARPPATNRLTPVRRW